MQEGLNDFKERVLDLAGESGRFISQTGGLPEIWEATQNLRLALDQTDREIAGATMASRFSRRLSDNLSVFIAGSALAPEVVVAVEAEGEAGYKRASLAADVRHLRNELMGLIHQLVELRCDLVVSQID